VELYVAGGGALHARKPSAAFSDGGNANYDATPTSEILAIAAHGADTSAADTHQTIEIVVNWARDPARLVP
jgi:hypothetical protein